MRLTDLPPVRDLHHRRSSDRRDGQLPEALERMASSLRSGRSLSVALADAAAASSDPLATELGGIVAAVEHGASVEAALAGWAAMSTSRDVALAGTALALSGRAGGEVARALDRVAATLRERRELRAEVRALATQARASALLLVLAPLAFALFASSVEPGVARFLFTTPAGWACLAAGLLLDGIGAAWMARIVEDAA